MATSELAAEVGGHGTSQIRADRAGENGVPEVPLLFPSRIRLLLFAVLLPAAVAGSNQLLFSSIASLHWLRSCLYPWMAFTTAVLSWCVGRYLDPAWLRWLVFAWCLALLDTLTIAACLGGAVPSHFGYVLVSAQISLLAVWAILGPWGWQWRLPTVLVAAAAIIAFSGSFANAWNAPVWNVLMTLTMIVVGLLCLGLRLFRFRLQKQAGATAAFHAPELLQANQFGLKHMLTWATAIVPLLLVMRGLDFLVMKAVAGQGTFSVATMVVCIATISLIAIWAVLGQGPLVIRLAGILITPYLLARGMTAYMHYVTAMYGPRRYQYQSLVRVLFDVGDSWMSWLCLNAALLAALLLFLRASGYRLARKIA